MAVFDRIGRFAGRALKGFRRPSRYRSNNEELIRDNRQMASGPQGKEENKLLVPLEKEEPSEIGKEKK